MTATLTAPPVAVEGLSQLTVMDLVEHLGLPSHPNAAVEYRTVGAWVECHTAGEFEAALVAVHAQEAAR